jgi:hypothetical protein
MQGSTWQVASQMPKLNTQHLIVPLGKHSALPDFLAHASEYATELPI